MFLKSSIEDLNLTYKAINMENEDTDFQSYDRLLTRTSDKILKGTEGRSVRHLHIHRLNDAPNQ